MRHKLFIGLVCLFHFSRILASAQITEAISTNSLLGVTGLAVSIGDLSPGLESSGLNVGQLRADAESRLKMTGMKIDPITEFCRVLHASPSHCPRIRHRGKPS